MGGNVGRRCRQIIVMLDCEGGRSLDGLCSPNQTSNASVSLCLREVKFGKGLSLRGSSNQVAV
jgi:hypothetical protein